MIAFIKGVVSQVQSRSCTVLTSGGTGYRIHMTDPGLMALPPEGSEVELHTSLVVREDAMELFGFFSAEERDTFEILTGISKIGARTALAILSVFDPAQLQDVVASGDPHPLTRVSGIGTKTAQHIFLELKYKLRSVATAPVRIVTSTAAGDAIAALVNLGYQQDECAPIVNELVKEEKDLDVSEIIRLALKRLARSKQ